MATTVTITSVDKIQNSYLVSGKIALTGNYATKGDTINLSSSLVPVESSAVPSYVEIIERPTTAAAASGYVWEYAFGSNLTNGTVQMFEVPNATTLASAGPLQEVPAGAYPATPTLAFFAIIPAL